MTCLVDSKSLLLSLAAILRGCRSWDITTSKVKGDQKRDLSSLSTEVTYIGCEQKRRRPCLEGPPQHFRTTPHPSLLLLVVGRLPPLPSRGVGCYHHSPDEIPFEPLNRPRMETRRAQKRLTFPQQHNKRSSHPENVRKAPFTIFPPSGHASPQPL